MSTHHSIIVARSATSLPLLPEVCSAFGTGCFNLVLYGDGWQMAEMTVWPHQWPTVGAGPGPIAAATGAPVLAAWISDTACAQMAADVPVAPSWTAHLVSGARQDCGYDHEIMNTLRSPGPEQPPADHHRLAADLAAWSAAAGRTTTVERIEAVLRNKNMLLQHRYRAMVGELGLGAGVAFERSSWTDDRIRTAWSEGFAASYEIPTPWNRRSKASPRSTALVAFLELHDAAKFDPTITEADLIMHAKKALATNE
ncbi:hypothetical protein AB0J72_26190 [Dactylosporangium sp. NPDC049742]|uniref:hypothetical protein n=1 Tax=Dactylosporangium sp. NPDC049742 TaxID=3154737 RepID=UPI0034345A71